MVRQLEKEREAALAAQLKLHEEYDPFTCTNPRILTPAERSAITALASDINGLGHAKIPRSETERRSSA